MKLSYAFGKDERLSRERDIKELFQKGSSFYLYPVKVLYLPTEESVTRVLISVSKRNFKRAVDRNLLKRRIREGYRLNKHILGDGVHTLGVIYTAKEILPSERIHQAILNALKRLNALTRPES
jgi:ribonuclease P protein component